MKLETQKIIKSLNDRLLTQNIILQTLIDIILENDLVTEDGLETKIKDKFKLMDEEINLATNPTTSDDLDEMLGFQYTGPIGEA
jgi:hypothetical protein